jgi:Fur family zinc uptake transcriptional regulator
MGNPRSAPRRGRRDAKPGFRSEPHDHAACIETALDRAAALCERRGARLTPIRREVLRLVWRGHAPVRAYDLLGALQTRKRGAAPPTVYRALEFLMAHGLVHRIETRNAFVGCERPDEAHAGQFLLCDGCGAAAELTDTGIDEAARRQAARLGFAIARQTVELRGLCAGCRERGASATA